MTGRPESVEAAPYYFGYIDKVPGDDVLSVLSAQLPETVAFLMAIPEEASLHRYAPEKWSIRQVVSHVNDTERVFLSRAFWFARTFDTPLPSFDEKVSIAAAAADQEPWARHIEEFRTVRQASLSLLENLQADAWLRTGIASGNRFTVRALAYILAGHLIHHRAIVVERYRAAF